MTPTRIPLPPTILVFAFRYALGRMSTGPSLVADLLVAHADRFDPHTRAQIVADIGAAIAGGRAGMACDVETWRQTAVVLAACDTPPFTPHDEETTDV